MNKPTAIIAEDEAVLRDELHARLSALWPELDVVATAADGIEAVRALDERAPDILFLDIRMPGMTGMEVARVASGKCHVAFITAYDDYAVAAFEQGAVDYVLKPFSAARLAGTVTRLKERLRRPPANLQSLIDRFDDRDGRQKDYLRWVTASQGTSTSFITVEQICYFQAAHKYTTVVTADKEAVIRRSIRELAEVVDPRVFWQIHRSTLLNIHAISGLTRDFRGRLQVRLRQRPEVLAVSEPYTHLFKQM